MREIIYSKSENPKMRNNKVYFGILIATAIILLAVFFTSCTKEVVKDPGTGTSNQTAALVETFPANLADTVAINPIVSASLKSALSPSDVSESTITLKQGTVDVQGTVSHSGTIATFTPSTDLMPETKYTATITVVKKSSEKLEHTWSFTTGKVRHDEVADNSLSIVSVNPRNNAVSVPLTIQPVITFKDKKPLSAIKALKITLMQGTTNVEGSIIYSGKTATFKPLSNLIANLLYTVTVTSGPSGNDDGEAENEDQDHPSLNTFSWSFTTLDSGSDTTAPSVITVVPINNASDVAVNGSATVTFSEAMTASTINDTNFFLKQGSTNVAGTVSYSGTTATFTPGTSLTANAVYTAVVTTGVKDAAGNAMASNYTWSFTTSGAADVTPPTVLSVVPAGNATSIGVNSNVTATFSEAMSASTITSTTFILKQGSTSVAGSVTYSGTTATFNPTNDLSGNTVYTATITTGVKDVAGNAIVSNYSWSFTTAATVSGVSFASQVFPIVQNKCMPCHSGSSPSSGISLTSYTQVKAIGSSLDNPGMYTKMGVTAAEQTLIKTWLAQGSLNN